MYRKLLPIYAFFYYQSTNRTEKGVGEYVIPNFPSMLGGNCPSGKILYRVAIAVRNKNNSILASDSPGQTRLPAEIHMINIKEKKT